MPPRIPQFWGTLNSGSPQNWGARGARIYFCKRSIEIFEAARVANAVIMTKDSDFIDLVCRLGTPPQILWLTCGNVTNRNLQQLLTITFPDALERLRQGEAIVEISSSR